MKRGVLIWSAVGVAAIGGVLAAWVTTTGGRDSGARGEVVLAGRRNLATVVKATGVVRPMVGAEVRVGSRASGVVRRLFARVGDIVVKGQLLAELEARELDARRDQAAAALASSYADLGYARAELRRKRELGAAQLLSSSDLELAARAAAVAEEQSTEAQANLLFAETQLGYARIRAPIAGVVASVATQEGETVAASLAAPTFVTLLDLTRLEVWAYVDETDIGRIRVGQVARFSVDTYPGHEFEGRVTAIYPQAEIRDNVVNYVTVVRFESPKEQTLRPEMTTTVAIAIETRDSVLSVPRSTIRREAGRSFVVVRRGSVDEKRFVTTGSRDDIYCEVVDGLHEGDAVVVANVNTK